MCLVRRRGCPRTRGLQRTASTYRKRTPRRARTAIYFTRCEHSPQAAIETASAPPRPLHGEAPARAGASSLRRARATAPRGRCRGDVTGVRAGAGGDGGSGGRVRPAGVRALLIAALRPAGKRPRGEYRDTLPARPCACRRGDCSRPGLWGAGTASVRCEAEVAEVAWTCVLPVCGSVGFIEWDGGTPPVFCTLIACRYPESISVILFAEALFTLVQNLALIVRTGRSYLHEGNS